MVDEAMDERRPNTQENGRDITIAPIPMFVTCMPREILPRKYNGICTYLNHELIAYQKLLEKTKIGKHADNYKHRNFLPSPDNKI